MASDWSRSGAERRQQLAYLLAWISSCLILICVLAYAVLVNQVRGGWLNDFAQAVLPGVALVAGTYLVAYLVLFRRGLSRDQQLVEEIVEGLVGRSQVAPEVIGFSAHPGRIDWDGLLEGASEVDIAGRWFSAWTAENFDALRRFFERGGRLRAFMLAPTNDPAIEQAAKQHSGYKDPSPVEPSRHKIETGARRLADAARSSDAPAKALQLRFIELPDVVLSQALFRFSGDRGEKLVLFGFDNFRSDRHRSPAAIVDLRSSEQLREFWATELKGLVGNSRLGQLDEVSEDEIG